MSSQQILLGSGAAVEKVYIDDLFSTYQHFGNSGTTNVQNGIDLTKGGWVWGKDRGASAEPRFFNTIQGPLVRMIPSTNGSPDTVANSLTAFNANGFTLGSQDDLNDNNKDVITWTMRKQEKFFDMVSYTGNGTNRTISHNLGSVPGMIMIKRIDSSGSWLVYHRGTDSTPEDYGLFLENTNQKDDDNTYWNDTAPTSSVFSVGTSAATNQDTATYIAFIFAHHNGDGTLGPNGNQDGIACGNYTGNGSSSGTVVNIGWEPQWIMIKRTVTNGGQWLILDAIRGITHGAVDNYLYADNNDAEGTYTYLSLTGTGFKVNSTSGDVNTNGSNYIYLAIRRPDGGVGKPPDAGTDVFNVVTGNGSMTIPNFTAGFPVDFAMQRQYADAENWYTCARLIQGNILLTNTTDAASSNSNVPFDSSVGWASDGGPSSYMSWMWKRHAGLDVQAYQGTGANQTIAHSLGVAPEMIWIKNRTRAVQSGATAVWLVWHEDLTSGSYSNIPNTDNFMELNTTENVGTGAYFNSTAPSSSVVSLGANGNKWDVRQNLNGDEYLMVLFASVAGICKVGTYAGNGSTKTVTTGFAPRYVMIRVITGAAWANWYVYDTTRGIPASGTVNYMMLNKNSAQEGGDDIIDVSSTGFTINVDWNSHNGSSYSYIYYAHA